MQKSVSSFVENRFWKEYLESAPSKCCKQYIKLEFYYSDISYANDEQELAAVTMSIELQKQLLSLADWKYFEGYAGNTPFKTKCREMIDKQCNDRDRGSN